MIPFQGKHIIGFKIITYFFFYEKWQNFFYFEEKLPMNYSCQIYVEIQTYFSKKFDVS